MPGGRRPDHEGGFRDLPGAGVGALAEAGASDCDGQPLFTRGREGQGARRGAGLQAGLAAALLT